MPSQPEDLDNSNNNNIEPSEEEEDEESTFSEEEEEDEDEEDESSPSSEARGASHPRMDREKLTKLYNRLSSGPVPLRVHDVVIKGNSKTKDAVIEAEVVAPLKEAATLQDILRAASAAEARLRALGVFDTVAVVLDSGPPELPGTANVLVQVAEARSPVTAELGLYTKPGARSWSFEGALKLKNAFGFADLWDGSVSYGLGQNTEIGCGVSLPRLGRWTTPVFARAFVLNQDWLKFSSYKEQALGLALGLVSTSNHVLVYNLTWRILTDPSQTSGMSVRRQLGHSLLSSLKYTYKVDQRNSPLRPTRGYAYSFTTLLAGLHPDHRSARFLRQEFDFRYALPLGFYHAALNFGISGGVIFPWGKGFLDRPSALPDRFFMGGNSSPVCSMIGPNSVWGFQCRGIGPTEPRRQSRNKPDGDSSAADERDAIGGDLAVSAFADLSFDLPLRLFRQAGIHGHMFASAGNLVKVTENEWRNFSSRNFLQSFRTSIGCGIIVPTKLFRMEVNYCHIMRQFEHDHGKSGVQFSFCVPS